MGDDDGGKRRGGERGGARDGGDHEPVGPSPGKRTRTQGLSRRGARTATPAAAGAATVWPRPKGCPPHLPYGVSALPVCDTGRLGELVRFVLRQAGAPEVWPGWTALHHAHADVLWADRFRAGQAVAEVHPDPALPAAMVTITAALASCEPVSATEPTYQAALVFEVRAELPDYRAGAPVPASVEADPGASSALRTAQQTLRTGSITFTMAPGMVDYDHALPREAPLDADLTGGPVDVADQGAERGARTTTAAPPPAPAPPSVGELMAVAVRPDAGAEFTSLRAELEAGLGRPLNGAELAQLTGLALARAAALERLERQQQLRALYDAQLAALQAQRDAALDAEVYEQPSYLDELATEAWEGGPVRIVRDIGHGFVALVERSGELQREAIGRGDYRGAAFAAPAAIVEQTVQTFGSISDNLRMTTEAIERVMEWRSTTDGIIGSTEAVLGIGMAMLEAWSLVEPVASLRRGGAATGGARLALVEAGAGSRAGQIAAAGAAVAEGSLARPAIVLTIARLRDADADALGDGPEADAVNEVDEARPGQEPEPEVQSEQAREPEVQSEQEPHPPRSRRNGETRNGIKRNNTADWRRIRETWDEAGYGAALSPANRTRITKGRTPIVDDAWIEWFPGDAALRGEKISIHHIKGGKLNVPLPKSRHQDAHMPGGFQTNPGGPGMTGALEEEDHGNRFA